MQAVTTRIVSDDVRIFIEEYFEAWRGTDENKILAYYSDDVVLQLPTGTLRGKTAVRDNFVRPFIAAFPGNVHAVKNLAHAENLVAVEWNFEAVHTGVFGNIEPTGRKVQVPGCSFYEHSLSTRTIPAGRIYFDFATLLRQLTE
jgi:predicted ester cyclase